ncbi:hypothetical protein [Microlunatus antarcticus]|uniref:HEAT repeat-containing protein n=1 Tax=Microlunatus antarcticus TaxID=53388 RepID=A0A7W5JU65_9ACTN|nr:hypothetical protein [Microlunatus antarcticus]MBB3326400.1 hypothetical protein [Microlunatus antarcticus]
MDGDDFEMRVREGEALAALVGDAGVDERLLHLLLDPWDTYVTFCTALALLARRDDRGVELVVRAAVLARDFNTGQWLFDAFGEVSAASLGAEDPFLRRGLGALTNSDDESLRLKAMEIRDWLGL